MKQIGSYTRPIREYSSLSVFFSLTLLSSFIVITGSRRHVNAPHRRKRDLTILSQHVRNLGDPREARNRVLPKAKTRLVISNSRALDGDSPKSRSADQSARSAPRSRLVERTPCYSDWRILERDPHMHVRARKR